MEPGNGKTGIKTLGLKLPDELHAQFALVAQLDGLSLTDAMRRSVELYVEHNQAQPDFAARAAAVLEEIEREAAARRGAIEALFGNTGTQPVETKATSKRRSSEASVQA
ncbi:hypothetical protein [Micromonospora sp. NBC_01796]|uniref:hypothetical protein n=1 Tax=Micromonospora sp. NBC_01796 TaxID=2975987 RepID=UPI002DDB48B1|nr:hypothetical protein [Micromonospora sp. NBC_01796]WSA86716.1 hypothetical protein OIE47_03560 [Micromonospora sp. NBC_01796]